MDKATPKEKSGFLSGFLSKLRFPQLFVLLLVLFLIDVVVPDPLPFVDELILGVLTMLLSMVRKPKEEDAKPPEKNVTPGVQ